MARSSEVSDVKITRKIKRSGGLPVRQYSVRSHLPPLLALALLDHLLALCAGTLVRSRDRVDVLTLRRTLGQILAKPFARLVELHHPLRHLTSALLHDIGDAPQVHCVVHCEESECLSRPPPAPRAPYPMNVAHNALGEVVVYDEIHTLEIDTTCHQVRADQHPDTPAAEVAHDGVPLRLRPVRMHHIHINPIEDQLPKQLLCAINTLHKHKHRRAQPLLHQLPNRHKLALLTPHKHQLLLHTLARRHLPPHSHEERVRHDASRELLDGGRHGSAEERLLQLGVRARGEHLVKLLHELQIE
mmetsp:Transcript_31320/g.76773  ORF Transcript_31320/g.76773 Transcript_31320/m.76773 type:complete len:301 (+) Transcript_31320:108-1010(+)